MSNNDKFKELYKAIGVLAETGILFYRATIQAGATPGEAMILTQAFIRASMQGDDTSASETDNPFEEGCRVDKIAYFEWLQKDGAKTVVLFPA